MAAVSLSVDGVASGDVSARAAKLAGAASVLAFQSIERLLFPQQLPSLGFGVWVISGSLKSMGVILSSKPLGQLC